MAFYKAAKRPKKQKSQKIAKSNNKKIITPESNIRKMFWLCDYDLNKFVQQYPTPEQLKSLPEHKVKNLFNEFLCWQKLFLFNIHLMDTIQNYHLIVSICILSLQKSYKDSFNNSCFKFTNRRKFYGVLSGLNCLLIKIQHEKNNLFTSTKFLQKVFPAQIKNWEPPLEVIQEFENLPPQSSILVNYIEELKKSP